MDILPVTLPETVFENDYIIATYYYKSQQGIDVYEKAKSFAIGQTLGTWLPVPGITDEMKIKYGGKVTAIYDIPPIELANDEDTLAGHIIQIAFPDKNFPPNFPMLFTTLLGNDVSTSAQVKLIDIKFSKNYLSYFRGPRLGKDGIYKYLGIEKRRPLILNMIKPCIGFDAKTGADLFYSVALGKIDFIKDDELLGDTQYSSILDRVKFYTRAAMKAYEATGFLTKYCVNITDSPEKIIENAQKAQEAGAGALMVNFIAAGMSTLKTLSENKSINIPVFGHYASAGAMVESPYCGISSNLLLGKLARIAGADACLFSSPYSTYPILKRRYLQIADALTLNLENIKSTMPIIGGGVHPNSAIKITKDLGKEIILASGGAIFGHPHGPTKGALAMSRIAEALGNDSDIGSVIQEEGNESLKLALELWK
ncbi:RuBisCO large subunit C-terminal-like domain-containing protein [bacterium]|nr:RuBisCO large subunit C-terminal-like domain-containing protein [bacterium]